MTITTGTIFELFLLIDADTLEWETTYFTGSLSDCLSRVEHFSSEEVTQCGHTAIYLKDTMGEIVACIELCE